MTDPEGLQTNNNVSLVNGRSKLFEIKKIKAQKKWTREEDEVLIDLAGKFNSRNWKAISSYFFDKTPLQCFSRYKRIRPGIIKGSWTKEEDQKIVELVAKCGKSWSKISKILVTRNGKQIRDRYLNILDPSVKKGKFSLEEDLKLLSLFKKYGPKWANISKFFEQRTADMIKNRFHSSIKKNMKFLEDLEADSVSKNIFPAKENGNLTQYPFQDSNSSFATFPSKSKGLSSIQSQEQNDFTSTSIRSNSYKYDIPFQSPENVRCLKIENVIMIEFIYGSQQGDSQIEEECNSWQLEDYFIL